MTSGSGRRRRESPASRLAGPREQPSSPHTTVTLPDDPRLANPYVAATKLFIPRPPATFVPRPRLTERVAQGIDQKLTLIIGPAGAGKTTLLTIWAAGRTDHDLPLAWLSLDAGDNDSYRFWDSFITALSSIAPGLGEGAMNVLRSPDRAPIKAVMTALVNEIQALHLGFAVVLDDYHVIEDQAIHRALSFLLDHLPESMHVVITSRSQPPLNISRLRARGQLNEIDAADLRFDAGESAAFLNEVMKLGLAPDDVRALEARTEGWVAGLQLAALSLRGRHVSEFISTFAGSNRFVFDYLADEVLSKQSQDVVDFLQRTAILDRLSGALCDAVTGRQDGDSVLRRLEQDNLFVVSLDDRRTWYRYHPLFRDVLRDRLGSAERIDVDHLHEQASQWYEENGFLPEALDHALAAQDYGHAADIATATAYGMFDRGDIATLLTWLRALPDDEIRARPILAIHYAWSLALSGQFEGIDEYLQLAEARAEEAADTRPDATEGQPVVARILGSAEALRAHVSRARGDADSTLEHARRALELLGKDDRRLRGVVAINMAAGERMKGHLSTAAKGFAEAVRHSRAAGHFHVAVMAAGLQARVHLILGSLRDAERACVRALRLAVDHRMEQVPAAGYAHIAMADLLREQNALERASQHATKGVELILQGDIAGALADAYAVQLKVLHALGDREAFAEIEADVEELIEGDRIVQGEPLVGPFLVRFCLADGDVVGAERWLDRLHVQPDDDIGAFRESSYIALARVLLARGELAEARGLLGRLLKVAKSGGRTGTVIEVQALLALSAQAAGDNGQALDTIAAALAAAERERYVRVFLDEGEPMRALLAGVRDALLRGAHGSGSNISLDYVASLLNAFAEETNVSAGASAPPSSLAERLSEREGEVLHLIDQGLSNQEIAEQFVVALSTVKWHVNNLFGKLGVRSRTQALLRARELNLLLDH